MNVMPGNGRRHFEFVGETPLTVWAAMVLLFANTLVGFALMVFRPVVHMPPDDQGLHKFATTAIVWHAKHWSASQLALLALLALLLVIYRKNIRYISRGPKPSE
jgi:hypothetical protein